MKDFLATWLIVGIGGLIALFVASAVRGDFWLLYLLGTAVLAGAINGAMSLLTKLEILEKRLTELEREAVSASEAASGGAPSEKM